MRHRIAGRRLSRASGHRMAMYRNLVTDLLNYEKVTTTEAKAKEVRGLAEKMITLGKKGGLHSRRQAAAFIIDKKVAEKVFSDLAPRYAERSGGYTRITKLGPRLGDGAAMAQLELVE
jgi:large subunit ribosomal protein L17